VGHDAARLSEAVTEPRPRVVRTGDGRISLRLGAQERTILAGLVGELRAGAAAPGAPAPGAAARDGAAATAAPDPVLARLYPPAFPDDPHAEAAFQDLVRADLEDDRRDRVAVVDETLGATSLDEAQAAAWMGVLNDLRLVLGTRLGVTDETEAHPIDEDDPDAERRLVYAYVGWLLGQFVDVLAAGLPDVRE
jgi:hypothetical protein